jgi:hypothetical protein
MTAYVAAELTGWFNEEDDTTEKRLTRLDSVLRANGVYPGGHVDAKAVEEEFYDEAAEKPKTGCGANDRLIEILQNMHDDPETINAYTDALLQEQAPVNEGPVSREEVLARNRNWNPTVVVNQLGNTDGGTVEILKDSHIEAGVVANYNENTTVDRDAVFAETGEQVFTVDMWYIDKIARALAVGSPTATEDFQQLRRAATSYQVGTYITLCDGSQLLLTAK